jgi:hypothetical protein
MPRRASSAETQIAIVVFPTPPFRWAIEMIMLDVEHSCGRQAHLTSKITWSVRIFRLKQRWFSEVAPIPNHFAGLTRAILMILRCNLTVTRRWCK